MYTRDNVALCEALYGKGLISLGGYEAVDAMFKGLDLSDKHLLDIGSGIGGMAHYLALKYGAIVTGLDVLPWMAEYASEHAPASVQAKLNFVTVEPESEIPLPSELFDIIYSKGVLTNVQNKSLLFKEAYRMLKPNGMLCLIDWVVPDSLGPLNETLPLGDKSYKETESSYKKLLHEAGFQEVQLEDRSHEYLEHVQVLEERLNSEEHKNIFAAIISDDLRDDLLKSNTYLKNKITNGQQLSMLIRATKR